MARIRAHVYISGLVQGVFFRAHTRRRAKELGIGGWIKNLRDGRVEAVFEGEEEDVKAIVEWCKKGPPGAIVEKVDVSFESPRGGFEDFKIVY